MSDYVKPTSELTETSLRARFSLGSLAALRDYGIVGAFVALVVAVSFASDAFLTTTNIFNILDQNAAIGIIACGFTLVLIAGGFDFSVGAVFAISGVVAAKLVPELGAGGALAAGALTGLAFGMVNGLIVTLVRINSFIATLATSIIISGLAVVITNASLISVSNENFPKIARNGIWLIKYSVFLWLGVAVILGCLLWRTAFGRQIYAVGGNSEAARLSGIRVNGVRLATFAICGATAGLGGIIEAARVATGQSDVGGISLVLTVVAAVVIGGNSILGGAGAIWRSVLGVLFLAVIGNAFNLLNLNPIYQQITQGAIILAAVGIDALAQRRSV